MKIEVLMNTQELHEEFRGNRLIRTCQYCHSIEMPQGGLTRITLQQKQALEIAGYQFSHGTLSLNCAQEVVQDIPPMKDYFEKLAERGFNESETDKRFYLTCDFK